jgi:hypothetical protein
MPTLAVGMFSREKAVWPRERGHGTGYTSDELALVAAWHLPGGLLRSHVMRRA